MSKNLNRGISILVVIGIVAILVVVVGSGIFAWQYYSKIPNVQTADWKTYSNTQYGFQFQYPSNFNVSEQSKYNGGINVAIGIDKSSNEHMPGLGITVDKNYPGSIDNGNLVDINVVSFTHSGGLNPNGMNVYSEYYEINRNNMVYSIHIGQDLSFGDPLQKDVIDIMTKIIQTFKFTD